MLYKVFFEEGEPVKAEEFHTTEINFTSGEYILSPKGEYWYGWRIVIAGSEVVAMSIAKN